MIGGILIQRKVYGMIDYLASCLLCIGLIVFTLADVELQTEYNYTGVCGMVLPSMSEICLNTVGGMVCMFILA